MKIDKNHPWKKPEQSSETAKLASSRNAETHGCTAARALILSTESARDFHALEAMWFKAYAPAGEAERDLVHQLVDAAWLLQRANRAFAEAEAQTYAETPNPADWTESQHKSLSRFLRYRTTNTNIVAKARKAVEDFRRNRALEQDRLQTMRHKEERLVIAQARLEIYKQKNQPELTWDEHLEGMRRQAIDLGLYRTSSS